MLHIGRSIHVRHAALAEKTSEQKAAVEERQLGVGDVAHGGLHTASGWMDQTPNWSALSSTASNVDCLRGWASGPSSYPSRRLGSSGAMSRPRLACRGNG